MTSIANGLRLYRTKNRIAVLIKLSFLFVEILQWNNIAFGDTLLKEDKNSRLHQLARKLNKIRKVQKKQIDILCNDILSAHGDFINHLKSFRFAADFYESLLGAANLDAIADSAGEFLRQNTAGCSIAIIFSASDSLQSHFYSTDRQLVDIPSHIRQMLTAKMVESVCHSSKVCSADDLCKMGFFASPAVLKRISLAAIGFNNTGPALGMILLYRSEAKPLSNSELSVVSSAVKGLAKVVKALQHANSIA